MRGRQFGQRVVYGSAEEAAIARVQQDCESQRRTRIRRAMRSVTVRPHDPRQLVYIEPAGDIARSLLYRVIR